MIQAPNDRLDQLEATLTRFAELSFQSYRHHDEALSRLEANSARHDEALLSHNDAIAATNANFNAQSATIDVLVANIQQLTENVAAVNQRVDSLAEQTTRNINNLAEQAAQDRQQAAIDRQEFRKQMEQRELEIRQIWEYLRDRNGGSSPSER